MSDRSALRRTRGGGSGGDRPHPRVAARRGRRRERTRDVKSALI